jgi:hypothetical protein
LEPNPVLVRSHLFLSEAKKTRLLANRFNARISVLRKLAA